MKSTTAPYPDFSCTVSYDISVPCVVMTWKGYATSAAFREGNAQILDMIRTHHAARLLGDIREFVLIGAEDQAWLSQVWIPRAISVGLRTVAMVTPVFYFNRVAVENVEKNLGPDSLALQYFDNRDDARAWLSTQ